MVSLVASRLVILLYTHLILALIINRRYYLDERTAFTLLCNWHQDGDIKFCNVASSYSIYNIFSIPRSASANSPSIKLSHAQQNVA